MAWVQVFNEVSTWLLDQENDQERLLEILQKIGIAIPQDIRQEGGEREPMWEIDPFTFFRLILRFGNDNRTNYFRELLGIINPEYEFPEEQCLKLLSCSTNARAKSIGIGISLLNATSTILDCSSSSEFISSTEIVPSP